MRLTDYKMLGEAVLKLAAVVPRYRLRFAKTHELVGLKELAAK